MQSTEIYERKWSKLEIESLRATTVGHSPDPLMGMMGDYDAFKHWFRATVVGYDELGSNRRSIRW